MIVGVYSFRRDLVRSRGAPSSARVTYFSSSTFFKVLIPQIRHTIRCNAGTQYTESASYGKSYLTVNPASDSLELAHVTPSLAGHLTRCDKFRSVNSPFLSLSGLETADSDILQAGHRLPKTLLKFRRMAWAACFEKAYDIHVESADHCIAWLWQVAPQGLDHAAQRSSRDADCTVMHLHVHRHVTQKTRSLQCKTLLRLFYIKLEGSMPCLPEQRNDQHCDAADDSLSAGSIGQHSLCV